MYIMMQAGRGIEKYQPLWGSWRVEGLIGQGNGFEVYRAYKEEWGRRYVSAVKLLSYYVSNNDVREAQAIGVAEAAMPEYFKSLVGNIRNEIELMYRLRGNSNIVTYEDHAIFEKDDGLGWDVLIRMEFLKPLPEFLIDSQLERADVVKLGIDICKALEACGREGIIHRDIRDSSIFVSPRGEFKLGSFSLAKENSKGGRLVHSQFNPLYMAPELYKDQGYNFSVDTYSLGIVMYKLLNKGRLPFLPLPPVNITAAETESSLARRIGGEELPLPADSGESLGAIILKACSYDKKDRYKSPAEFSQKLERQLKAEVKSAKLESAAVKSTIDFHRVETNNGKVQINEENEKADVQSAYSEELERIAVAELASSADKIENERRSSGRRFARNICIWAALMVLAFAFAFICAYEVEPDNDEPVPKPPQVTVEITPAPVTASTPTPEPIVTNETVTNETATKNKEVKNKAKTAKKQDEMQMLHKKAEEHYERHEYEKAIAAFEELVRLDASYSNAAKYADSFFKLAEEHNALGMKYHDEGRLESSVEEFEAATEVLLKMKSIVDEYDQERYNKWNGISSGNRNSVLEKIMKIDDCFKLADEYNREGVKLYEEGSYERARLKIEKALEYLDKIRVIVPNYSSRGYEGIVKIYEGNLSRIEEKL